MSAVRRGFADVTEGQVHYRESGWMHSGSPLVLLHPSPGSAQGFAPLIAELGDTHHVIALDTLGNGDSSAPAPPADEPLTVDYLAGAQLRALDTLGVDRFAVYGSHTGANLAAAMALSNPDRIGAMILDGISLYTDEQRADMLANYAREIPIEGNGSQFFTTLQFVRDVYLFWPWYRTDAEHTRGVGLPSADALHDKVVEVLKALRTFHLTYNAAIAYDKRAILPRITVPTLLACARSDMFTEFVDEVRALMPRAAFSWTAGVGSPAAVASTARIIRDYLSRVA